MTRNTTHGQHPLGSGFTPASTVDDVLEGIDLTGRNVIVTGGHAGLGLVATRALAAAGASVTVGSRDPDRAATRRRRHRAASRSAGWTCSTRRRSTPSSPRYLDSGRPLHILINNAGFPGSRTGSCTTRAATRRSSRPTTSATSS